jgi:threonylcarbamoyladenosine tRNA methylthiotransferase MtaB
MNAEPTAESRGNRTVAIATLGCRTNHYDSSAMEEILREENLTTVSPSARADVYIINTCTVTGRTDRQSRQLIRKLRRQNPSAVVIVTGCYAQVSPTEVARIEGVDYILGNSEKSSITECIKKGRPERPVTIVGKPTGLGPRAGKERGRTRADLKIQDGCNRRCSFCIIPTARGPSRSLPLAEVLKEVEALIREGFKEIVLTGIHLGAYGLDLSPAVNITGLIREIERRNYYPVRFRVSSLDPDEITEGLIEILGGASTICPHLHIALQSGDDRVLRAMRRPYSSVDFRRKVERLYSTVKDVAIGVDAISGFPGETEEESERTVSLLEGLPVSYMHVFPYSRRKGTPAAALAEEVAPAVIKRRVEKLLSLDKRKREAFYRGFIGKVKTVLIEAARDKATGLLKGRTENYIPVFIEGKDELKSSVASLHLTGVMEKGMNGVVWVESRR